MKARTKPDHEPYTADEFDSIDDAVAMANEHYDVSEERRVEIERLKSELEVYQFGEQVASAKLAAEVERLRRIEQLALIWSAYQHDDSINDQRTDARLRMMAENAADDLLAALDTGPSPPTAHSKSQQKRFDALRRIDLERFQAAPCYICGYNGPGYYQPEVHECAGRYHEQTNELP